MKIFVIATLCIILLVSCAPSVTAIPTKIIATRDADFDKWVATQTAKRAECETLDKLALVSEKAFLPGDIVFGPAEIKPSPGIAIIDLSIALGIDMPTAGGLIITSGNSVKIPQELTLASDKTHWIPNGNVITYANDELMWKHIACWTAAKSP